MYNKITITLKEHVNKFRDILDTVSALIEEGHPELEILDKLNNIAHQILFDICYSCTMVKSAIGASIQSENEAEASKVLGNLIAESSNVAVGIFKNGIKELEKISQRLCEKIQEGSQRPANELMPDFATALSIIVNSYMICVFSEDALGVPVKGEDKEFKEGVQAVVSAMTLEMFNDPKRKQANKEYYDRVTKLNKEALSKFIDDEDDEDGENAKE
ncbi:MAG: hypothetical protein ACTSR2_00235 [Candidatus Hodarchaeales archaeon]